MKIDRLKEVKDYLRNVMTINESKMKIAEITSGCSSEDDLTIKDLESLITEVKIIIKCNKKYKLSNVNELNLLEKSEKLLKKRIKKQL